MDGKGLPSPQVSDVFCLSRLRRPVRSRSDISILNWIHGEGETTDSVREAIPKLNRSMREISHKRWEVRGNRRSGGWEDGSQVLINREQTEGKSHVRQQEEHAKL